MSRKTSELREVRLKLPEDLVKRIEQLRDETSFLVSTTMAVSYLIERGFEALDKSKRTEDD